MDPLFQPQNSSPYPQDPSGYPQAAPYDPQGTNSGPNKYPTLPLAQNDQNPQYPQYNHDPQQSFPPQPSPQQYYPSQQYPQYNPAIGGHPGYLPPAQYGNHQNGQGNALHMERMLLNTEMKELEASLDSGHLQCYTIWSGIVAVIAFLTFLYLLFIFFTIPQSRRSEPLILGLGVIWFVFQSYFAIASKHSRSLSQATVACWMVCVTLIPSLFLVAFFLNVWFNYKNGHDQDIVQLYACFTIVHLLIHILVNMVGAFKVRSILVKKAKVEMQLVEHSFQCQA